MQTKENTNVSDTGGTATEFLRISESKTILLFSLHAVTLG